MCNFALLHIFSTSAEILIIRWAGSCPFYFVEDKCMQCRAVDTSLIAAEADQLCTFRRNCECSGFRLLLEFCSLQKVKARSKDCQQRGMGLQDCRPNIPTISNQDCRVEIHSFPCQNASNAHGDRIGTIYLEYINELSALRLS